MEGGGGVKKGFYFYTLLLLLFKRRRDGAPTKPLSYDSARSFYGRLLDDAGAWSTTTWGGCAQTMGPTLHYKRGPRALRLRHM